MNNKIALLQRLIHYGDFVAGMDDRVSAFIDLRKFEHNVTIAIPRAS